MQVSQKYKFFLPHYPPPRKAEKPKGGNPGSRAAEKDEMPIRLKSGRSDETSCASISYGRYATLP